VSTKKSNDEWQCDLCGIDAESLYFIRGKNVCDACRLMKKNKRNCKKK